MKINKLYFPVDAISRHEDFSIFYEDGDVALTVKGAWESEKDKVTIFGRMGGESGHIKPDNYTLTYNIRVERYTYVLHPYTLFKHYHIEGMLWQIYGSLAKPPVDFISEKSDTKDAHVRVCNFRDKGDCYEIKVKDISKLRIAAISTVAIAIKEYYKGKSIGETPKKPPKFKWLKELVVPSKGIAYEDLPEWVDPRTEE